MRRIVDLPFHLTTAPHLFDRYHQWPLPRPLAKAAGLHPGMPGHTTFIVDGESVFCEHRGIGLRWFVSVGLAHAAEIRALCVTYDTRSLVIRLDVEDSQVTVNEDAVAPIDVDSIGEALIEGAVTRVTLDRHERRAQARRRCIGHHGPICRGCGFDFAAMYGPHGAGFIHVHHLVPIAKQGGAYEVDPVRDLVPVCPNCHAMIHRRTPMLEMAELRALVERGR